MKCWQNILKQGKNYFSKTYLAQKNVIEKLQENVSTGKHQTMMESACYLMSYIGDILAALKHSSDRERYVKII